jgi:hypothetical protein
MSLARDEAGEATGVELAHELAEPVVERETAPVRLPVVDHEHAEILEGALEDAAAAVPSRAGGGERVEGIGAAGGADPVHAAEHVVERARRRDGDLRRVPTGVAIFPSLQRAASSTQQHRTG